VREQAFEANESYRGWDLYAGDPVSTRALLLDGTLPIL
jgi:hypothetical protein